MEVTNIHIHVDWNGIPLYDEDFKQDNTYDSTYSYSLGWNVPAFAPSGKYAVKIRGTGNAGSVQGGNVICVNANFDL